MKTFCQIVAFITFTGFSMLVSGALFKMVILDPRVTIELPVPSNPYTLSKGEYVDTQQLDCMARNLFFEARGESAKGKVMVAYVVLERTKSVHFPDTICGVVNQANHDELGRIIRYQCSFSWVCDGLNHSDDFSDPSLNKEWEQSYEIAKDVMLGKIKAPIDMTGVTNYHANYVKPYWAKDFKDFKLVATIDHHLFYKWRKATLPKLELASR
jgi:spore germination cell wall hydrolase CwlJ-like protein